MRYEVGVAINQVLARHNVLAPQQRYATALERALAAKGAILAETDKTQPHLVDVAIAFQSFGCLFGDINNYEVLDMLHDNRRFSLIQGLRDLYGELAGWARGNAVAAAAGTPRTSVATPWLQEALALPPSGPELRETLLPLMVTHGFQSMRYLVAVPQIARQLNPGLITGMSVYDNSAKLELYKPSGDRYFATIKYPTVDGPETYCANLVDEAVLCVTAAQKVLTDITRVLRTATAAMEKFGPKHF